MTADALLIELAARNVRLVPEGDALRFEAPKGAMTEPLAAALSREKALLLAVHSTVRSRKHDAAWLIVEEWARDDAVKTFTPAVLAAARQIHLAIPAGEWPVAAARRFLTAARVRALLRAFGDPAPVLPVATIVGAGREPETPDAA